jgi:hypothetical protein
VSREHAGWVSFNWRGRFWLKRLTAMLLTAFLPAAVLLSFGHGIPALVAFSLGLWPFPYRLSAGSRGFTYRWLFIRETVPLTAIAATDIMPDPRPRAISARPVLRLTRHHAPALYVFSNEVALRELRDALRVSLDRKSNADTDPRSSTASG